MDVNDEFIVFDTETTGIDPDLGHRVIEIGAVVVRGGVITDESFHVYVDPERDIPFEASEVHGLTRQDCVELGGGKKFSDIADDLLHFFEGKIAVAHNAPFDVGFLDSELIRCGKGDFSSVCKVIDSLGYANNIAPSKKNSLDQLSKRYGIDGFDRTFHGALLDSMILAKVFVAMRKSQSHLNMQQLIESSEEKKRSFELKDCIRRVAGDVGLSLPVVGVDEDTQSMHGGYIKQISEDLDW